ncbi:MAG: hypothetical protein IJR69_01150 [Bacteroidaceae bacterium]|nr:hypothetical protein [Bacteroidaceae bacterium]
MQRKVFTPIFPKREDATPAPSGQSAQAKESDATAVLRKLGACELRSAFAQAIFKHMRKNFQSESEFRKTVGQWVARDIATDVELRMEMQRLGYRPHERGYTLPQRMALVRFYMRKIKPLSNP